MAWGHMCPVVLDSRGIVDASDSPALVDSVEEALFKMRYYELSMTRMRPVPCRVICV